MQFVYKPEGADPRTWDFDPSRLMSPEVEAIERNTGFTFQQWMEACEQGSFLAYHGLLYVMLKRTAPTLKWDEVQFCMADIDFQLDDDEAAALLANLEAKAAAGNATEAELATIEKFRAEGVEPKDAAPKA